jgi:hypothetical protein
MCKNVASVNPRSLFEIQETLESHLWELKSSDKSPWGITARFACTSCGDEYVAMITSPRGIQSGENVGVRLEVSAENVVLK